VTCPSWATMAHKVPSYSSHAAGAVTPTRAYLHGLQLGSGAQLSGRCFMPKRSTLLHVAFQVGAAVEVLDGLEVR
jgi:hypothetical protein